MRAVNLLPRDVQNTGSGAGRKPLLVVAGGIAAVTAASAVMVLSASGSVADQRSQLRSVEDAIARIPAKESPAVAPGVITQERTERTAALSAALANRVSMDRLLREVAYVIPEDAWLTALSATVSPTTAAAPGMPSPTSGQGVSIVGATYSHSSVARVLSRLAAVPSLDDVRLTGSARVVLSTPTSQSTSTSKVTARSKSVVTFTISANVRGSTA
jgi:hypothetical protein